jgi:2-dehydro-3-deoxyphosphogluconate aldolase / (4S)-4-hydroxy-2-oxoglutarate aldolase
LRAIVAEVPQMLAGIGTILTSEQAREAKGAGAAFGVSPGVNPRVVHAAQDAGLAFAPGICTPSDIECALELGCTNLKFFPAGQFGGLPYLNAMAAPYLHLGVRFIPLGGVGPKNLAEYLADPLVLAVGGSWLAPRDVIRRGDWQAVTDAAAAARKVLDQVRK